MVAPSGAVQAQGRAGGATAGGGGAGGAQAGAFQPGGLQPGGTGDLSGMSDVNAVAPTIEPGFSLIERSGSIGSMADDAGIGSIADADGVGTASTNVAGRTSAGRTGGIGGGRGGLGGGIGGLGGLGGGGLFGNAIGGGQATEQQSAIRTRLRSGIVVDPVPTAVVQRRAASRLQQLPVSRRIPGVQVIMNGRTAVLSGAVRSERDRRMSELMLRLEPGISRIENRLTLQP